MGRESNPSEAPVDEVLVLRAKNTELEQKLKASESARLQVEERFKDLTSNKHAEESLKRYECMVSSTTDLMAFVDTEYRYQAINKRYAEILEKPHELLIGRLVADILGSVTFERIKPYLDDCLSGKSVSYQHWMDMPEGGKRYFDVQYHPAVDSDGSVFGIVADVRDLTDLKLAEQNMHENHIFLTAIVENIPDMIFVKDAKSLQFLRFNKAGEELVGHPKEAMIGKTDYDFFSKSEADFYTTKDREVLSGKILLDIPEEVIQSKSQGTRYLHTKKIPILDDHGTPQYLLGISQDITEQRLASLERTERELLLRLIFETGSGCIKRVAADGTLLHMNPAGLELIEAEAENEALGLSVFDLVVPEHIGAFRHMHQNVLQGKPQTLQFEVQGIKGTRRWMETYAVLFNNPIT